MPLTFAYGANLDRFGMAQRCPRSTALRAAHLDGYRFVIMTAGYATVRPAAGAVVHGLLWDIDPTDLAVLDAYEEVEAGLYRRTELRVTSGGRSHLATVYLANDTGLGVPVPGYMETVLAAAAERGLPEAYLAELRAWLPEP